jgi:hypothetical protein
VTILSKRRADKLRKFTDLIATNRLVLRNSTLCRGSGVHIDPFQKALNTALALVERDFVSTGILFANYSSPVP